MYPRYQRVLGEHLDQSHTSIQANSFYSYVLCPLSMAGLLMCLSGHSLGDEASDTLTT